MAEVVPPNWSEYFTNLSSFMISCERKYGLANEKFTEYALERLSQSYQSLQDLVEIFGSNNDLSRLHADLLVLLQSVLQVWQKWSDYSDTLDAQFNTTRYVPSRRRGLRVRPKFYVTKEQLQYLRSTIIFLDSYCKIVDHLQNDPVQEKSWLWNVTIQYQQPLRVQQILTEHPQVGQTFISGRLRSLGYRVTREHVRQVIRFLDPLSILKWQVRWLFQATCFHFISTHFHCISTSLPPHVHCISTSLPLHFHCISTLFPFVLSMRKHSVQCALIR